MAIEVTSRRYRVLVVFKHLDHARGWEMGDSLAQGFEFYGHDVFRHGQDSEVERYGISLKDYYSMVKPEIVVVVDTHDEYETGFMTNSKNFYWAVDSHLIKHHNLKVARDGNYHAVLMSCFLDVPHMQSTNKEKLVTFFPNAANTFKQRPLEIPKKIDIGFCGSVIPNSNRDWLNKADWVIRQRRLHKDMVFAINEYRVHVNQCIGNDMNARIFETMACMTPLVTNDGNGVSQSILPEETVKYLYKNCDESHAKANCEAILAFDKNYYKKFCNQIMRHTFYENSYNKRAKTITELYRQL